MDFKQIAEKYSEELISLRRYFHKHPELGYEEVNTSKKIVEYLKALGLKPEIVTKTGVVATIYADGATETILLRADIDAIKQEENTGLSFSSETKGIMHACGHDGHTAVLLVTAKVLTENKDKLTKNIKLVFQPNEEEAGALAMIEAGILENPKVNAAYAQHIWSPLKTGVIGVAEGSVMAATEHFEIVVKGSGGHTAAPHLSVDPIPAACQIVSAVSLLQTREVNPLDSIVIMFGEIHGGTASNAIAENVTLSGTIRFIFNEGTMTKDELYAKFERAVKGVCLTCGVEYELHYIPSNPPMLNDKTLAQKVSMVAKAVVGAGGVVPHYSMAGEDFSEITQKVPSCFFFIGTGSKEKGTDYPHHHSKFNIDEDSLLIGLQMFLGLALN